MILEINIFHFISFHFISFHRRPTLKHLEPTVVKHLCWLFNNVLNTSIIPKDWKIARIVPMLKKGSKTDVNNFRPISNISS